MKTAVIGGGPAGMISAYFRAVSGDEVVLVEKNEKLGKKLYITGKGRCNVTNDCDEEEFLSNVVTNPKFLMSAVKKFCPADFMRFLSAKLRLKTERGNRVFPLSDKASDVTACLESYLRDAGVAIRFNEEAYGIEIRDGKVCGIKTSSGITECDNVIVATGGKSYSSTGSTGDGYKFAAASGHTIIPAKPALCGINVKGDVCRRLQGVSLKNVRLTAVKDGKTVFSDFGEMMFTHFGISGPIVLTASSYLNKFDPNEIKLFVDLKPALTYEQLDARLLRDFDKYKNKRIKNSLDDLLPKSLIPIIIETSGINGDVSNSDFRQCDRAKLVETLKAFPLVPSSLRDVEEAIVTSGGVNVKEIDPKTMESKLVKGLYFVGEVLDVDALTGGFNITIAAMTDTPRATR